MLVQSYYPGYKTKKFGSIYIVSYPSFRSSTLPTFFPMKKNFRIFTKLQKNKLIILIYY